MLKRIATGVALLAATIALLAIDARWTRGWLIGAVGVILAGGSLRELLAMTQAKRSRRDLGLLAGAIWTAAVVAGAWAPDTLLRPVADVLVVASLVAGALMAVQIGRGPGPSSYRLARSLWFCVPYVGGLSALLALVAAGELHFAVTVAVVAKTSDIGAYLVGRTWGRSALAPRISPNKTRAGALGGVVVPGLVGAWALSGGAAGPVAGGLAGAAALGVALGCVAIVSDLTESLIKRSCDVKDSGKLFGESGGWLDLVDSLLLVGPFALIYTSVLA